MYSGAACWRRWPSMAAAAGRWTRCARAGCDGDRPMKNAPRGARSWRGTRRGLPTDLAVRGGADLVDRQIGAFELLFLRQAQAQCDLEQAIDHQTANSRPSHAHGSADQLGAQAHAAQAPQGLAAEQAGGHAAPGAAQAVQGPDTQHVIDLPFVL